MSDLGDGLLSHDKNRVDKASLKSYVTTMSAFYNINIYQTIQGNTPYTEWLMCLRDRQAQSRIIRRVQRMEQGNFGDCAPVGEGVSELRINYGPGYRLYFCTEGERILLLLCGGDKHTQSKDIATAKSYKRDYKTRL